jgi:HlyD family secretion protein
MLNKFRAIKSFILSHKILSIILFLILAVGLFFLFKNISNNETRYYIETVKKDNIIKTVTGTGQVEALNSINLKTETSGDINYIGVKLGDFVKKGTLIASVDCVDEKNNLETAKINLYKLTDSNSLTVVKKNSSLESSYKNGWNKVSSFVTDATVVIEELADIYNKDSFLGSSNINKLNLSSSVLNKIKNSDISLYKAEDSLKNLARNYNNLSSSSSNNDIKELVVLAYDSSKIILSAIKETEATFNSVVYSLDDSTNGDVSSNRETISGWLTKISDYVDGLYTVKNNINEEEISYKDTSDIRTAELSLEIKRDIYNGCFSRAPFDGVIGTLTAQIGESSGSSIGTIITKQKIASVSFNEVDVASIEIGQKVNLTFDAISDLNITGTVVEIASTGIVSSGVVTYEVKISFDQDNEKIKPGMSVNAEIVTQSKENVLAISSNSIKSRNGVSYVEIFETLIELNEDTIKNGFISKLKPAKKEIKVGISNETLTEIVSGLNEGDQIILKSNNSSSKTLNSNSTNKKTSGVGVPMGGSAMGGIMH